MEYIGKNSLPCIKKGDWKLYVSTSGSFKIKVLVVEKTEHGLYSFTSEFFPLPNKKRSLISGGTSKNVDLFMNHIFINQEYHGFVRAWEGAI